MENEEQMEALLENYCKNMMCAVEPKVSPMTFCRVFPFHLMFNRDLTIVQTGCTITRVIPQVCSGNCKLNDILLTVSSCNYNSHERCVRCYQRPLYTSGHGNFANLASNYTLRL